MTIKARKYLSGVNVKIIALAKGDSREESNTDHKLGLHLYFGEYFVQRVRRAV